jgi:hypothetical protein
MLSHYIPRPVEELQFAQISATKWKQNMPGKTAYPVVRLQDGSIDYRYYATRGLRARNGEMKTALRRLMGKTSLPLRKLSRLPAIITIGLTCPHPPVSLRR